MSPNVSPANARWTRADLPRVGRSRVGQSVGPSQVGPSQVGTSRTRPALAGASPTASSTPDLARIPDDELVGRLRSLLADSRRVEADLVAHLGEVDARRLYAREAVPSMFEYCTRLLHFSEQEAYLRITVARCAREHPAVLTMLREGRLHLSGIARLAPHLTTANAEGLLSRAAGRTRREIDELLAGIAPRPDAATIVRKLPERWAGSLMAHRRPGDLRLGEPQQADPQLADRQLADPQLADPRSGDSRSGDSRPGDSRPGDSQLVEPQLACSQPAGSPVVSPCAIESTLAPLQRSAQDVGARCAPPTQLGPNRVEPFRLMASTSARLEPLAPGRYRVQFTASAALRDKLERLRALMRSAVPDGDLAMVIEQAVTEKLERLESRRFASVASPRRAPAAARSTGGSRHIPAAVRRAVYARDGGRCAFRDGDGRRCPERHQLEFHHRVPFGCGGSHDVESVCLMCRAHNRLMAEHDYGREAMARFRRRAGPRGAPGNDRHGPHRPGSDDS